MDVTAGSVLAVWQRRADVRGLCLSYEPRYLRFFQARFARLQDRLTISSLRLDKKSNLSKTMMKGNSNSPSRRLARVFGSLLLVALLPGPAAATPLRVVTYNIHGGHGDLAGNLTTFRDTMLSGEDVLCLQEVPVGGNWNTVKSVFPEYPHTFQTVNTTTGWIWPWESQQQTSVAILSKHPFQLTHSQLIQIDPGGDEWERHAQHVRIDPGTGAVDVFNFHNTYNWFENDYESEQAGLAKFRDYVSGRLGVATPADAGRLVMAGDFNLLAAKVAAILPTPSRASNGLDHVCSVLTFTSKGTYGTYGAGLSDHNAVWAVANAGSSACDMLSFTIDGMTGIIDGTDVTVTVPFGTDVTTLDPTFTLSPGATADPPSGTTRNFTTPQSYTITARDGLTTRTYTAAVHQAAPPGVTWDTAPGMVGTGDSAVTGGAGIWDTNNGNWTVDAGANNIAWINGNNDTAIFGGTAGTVTVATGGVTVGGLQFNTNNYLVGGDPINFGAAGGINVSTGTSKITAAITSSFGLTKTGSGTVLLKTMQNTLTGNISVQGGTLFIGADSADNISRRLGSGNFTGDIDIASGATFQFWTGVSEAQEFSGVISGAGNVRLAYKGNYTLSGDNTYTGKTTVHGEYNGNTATLNVSSFNSVNGGSPPLASSSLGAPTTVANGTVDIGRTGMQASAILNYTGPGETTDRVMNLVSSGNSQRKGVSNLGSGTLTFTSPWIGPVGVNNNTIPITTNADMILNGSVPDNFLALEKRGNAKLSLSGPCTIYNNVSLHAGTLEVDSEINDGGVYAGAIGTGPGDGGTNFINVPAGTPIAVGMSIVHPRLAPGTTVVGITDINANPIIAQISSNSDATNRAETGYIGFNGALGIIPPTAGKLRWFGDATLKYDGPDDSTNRNFTIDNTFTSTWEIITGSTLEVSGATTNTTGKITKTGAGTLILSGNLLHDGVNNVDAGTLLINGNSSGMTGDVNVNNTAILGGSGTIGGSVVVGSTAGLAPGTSIGTLTIAGDLDISAMAGVANAGVLNIDLDTIAASDRIATGTVNIGTGVLNFADFNFTAHGGLENGTYTLISSGAAVSGTLDTTPANLTGTIGAGPATGTLRISGSGTNIELVVSSVGGLTGYALWASANAPSPQTPDQDYDLDGVSNAVEFVLGGDKDTNDLGKLPEVGDDGTNMIFSFERDQDSIDASVSVEIEVGTDLGSWPDSYTVGADTDGSDAGVTVSKDDPESGTDTVTLSVTKAPDTRKFARLKVVIAP
ncbi:MAG: DUF5018 domain-containing protein [Luteolibacter sp.]